EDVDARQTLVLAIRRRRIALAGHDGKKVFRALSQLLAKARRIFGQALRMTDLAQPMVSI
ncbi:MAG: hypothetical protein ACLP1D_23740, partial [Xanthobacteraceae bacterium]